MEKSIHIPLEFLVVPPLAVRVNIDEEKVLELAETAKTHGMIEPLVVRPSKAEEGKYEVVCGLRRLLAAQKAGLPDVPCIVKEMSDLEAMEAMLVENLQREDLTDYEVGRWFKLLMERFPDKYPNLQTVAKRFGYRTHAIVSLLVSHYEFVENIKQKLPPNIVTRVTMLPERFLREIRRAPEDLQPKLVRAVCDKIEKCEREKREGKEDVDFPTARDVATLVDSYIMKWDRELKAKEEEEREAEKPKKPKKAEPEKPEKPEVEEPEEMEKPKPPSKPEAPSEEEIGARLEEVMRKRREEERQQREESLWKAMVICYPSGFLKDLNIFCGEDTPVEKKQKLAYHALDYLWDEKLKKHPEVKMEAFRVARSWM